MRKIAISWLVFGLLIVAAVGLASWPGLREQARVRSGLRAAELGAKLAFAENVYRERFGAYTRDLARLGTVLEEPLPCPLEEENTVLSCPDYRYSVEGDMLTAVSQADPSVYITFGLTNGRVDCSHALQALRKEVLCSAFN